MINTMITLSCDELFLRELIGDIVPMHSVNVKWLWGIIFSHLPMNTVHSYSILLLFIQQTMMAISAAHRAVIGCLESPLIRRMLNALMYYNYLLTFCFHELDALIESDDDVLMNVHAGEEIHIFNRPPCNRTIDALSDEDAYSWT